MNNGAIPGFYFDTHKQKYFRIQPGHKVPAGVQYALSHIQKEARAGKRSRAERKQRNKSLLRITSPLRTHGSISSILMRESGQRNAAQVHQDIDDTFVTNLAFAKSGLHGGNALVQLGVTNNNIMGAHPLPDQDGLLLQLDHAVGLLQWDNTTMDQPMHIPQDMIWYRFPRGCPTAHMYKDSDTGISTCIYGMTTQHAQVQWGSLSSTHSYAAGTLHSVTLPSLTTISPYIWDVSALPGNRIVLATVDHLVCLNEMNRLINVLPLRREAKNLECIDRNTVATGQDKKIRLWDVRCGDSLTRFLHNARVTGIKTVPASAGSQLMVSDNHGLMLYDLRMTSKLRQRSAISFVGLHEGPRMRFDVAQHGLVAAYVDEHMKVFSLNSGKMVSAFALPAASRQDTSPRINQIAWHETARGVPYVQACASTAIWRWTPNVGANQSDDHQ